MKPDFLSTLAEHDRELAAPVEVEARVLGAFRRRKWRRAVMRGIWFAGAAAAVAAGFVVERGREVRPVVVVPVVQVAESPTVVAEPIPVVEKVVEKVAEEKVRRAKPVVPPHEVVTQFFPLMDAPPPFERGELVRVTLPASAMLSVGMPVPEEHLNDRVQADVLIGQEGFARAIRFVSYER